MVPILDMHADVFMDLVRRREARNAASFVGDEKSRNAQKNLGAPDDFFELEERHLNRIKSGGIVGAVLIDCRMAGEAAEPEHLEQFIVTVRRELAAAGDRLIHVKSATDLDRALAAGRFAAIVGYEGLNPTKGDLSWIRRLYDEAGLRVAVLTHNDDNEYGGGALGARGGARSTSGAYGVLSGGAIGSPTLGLTEKGCQAVALMNELGILIDMAHAGPKTRRDILALRPSCDALPHFRQGSLRQWPQSLRRGNARHRRRRRPFRLHDQPCSPRFSGRSRPP